MAKINWNPSPRVIQTAKQVYELTEYQKLTNKQIAKALGYHWTYIVALRKKYKQMKGLI